MPPSRFLSVIRVAASPSGWIIATVRAKTPCRNVEKLFGELERVGDAGIYCRAKKAEEAGLDPKVADDVAHGVRPATMKDDETALYDLAMVLYRDKKVSDDVDKAALRKFAVLWI
jgi:hypothetical protein